MAEEGFTVKNGKVDIIGVVRMFNGVPHDGEIRFKGDVVYVQNIREAFGNALISIKDRKE